MKEKDIKENKEAKSAKQLAAVRVRGITGVKTKVKDTMNMLRLYRNNYCVVLPNSPLSIGMLKKAKDYITWGEIDEETFNTLVSKRGEEYQGPESDSKEKIKYNDFVVMNNKKMRKYFRLNAPRKGFGRKGIKYSFQQGGALGYRGEKINDLIKRMV